MINPLNTFTLNRELFHRRRAVMVLSSSLPSVQKNTS